MLSTALAMTPDFKAMVMESVRRSAAEGRLPGRGEAVLIGQGATGGLIKVRISRRYRLFDAYMVRGLIQLKGLDRLGILIGDDFEKDMPGRGLLALVDRDGIDDEGAGADPRLASLARAARREWSTTRRPMQAILGRPWPIAGIVFLLVLDLVLGLVRMRLVVAGDYSWLPPIPPEFADALYAAYLVVVATTAVTLWRRLKLGYGLALTLAVIQLVRTIVLATTPAQPETLVGASLSLALNWLFPVVILLSLAIVYADHLVHGRPA